MVGHSVFQKGVLYTPIYYASFRADDSKIMNGTEEDFLCVKY
jgi:hypothetical protein